MQKWMRRFLLISLLSVFAVSCKTYQIENAVKRNLTVSEYKNSYFSDPEKDYVYKAHIEVYGKQLSGIFIAKRISEAVHRVVFTTDFGNTLLDFELSETDFKVNYIQDDLDRKVIVNTLRDDFRLLLKVDHQVQEVFENEDCMIYKSADKDRYNYFFEDKEDKRLVQVINASKSKKKVIIGFDSKNTIFAEDIIIQHKNIKLTITLNQITN